MRLVTVMVLAGLVALPLDVSAQASDKERLEDFYPGTLPESPQEFDEDRLDDFYPESARPSEPTPEEPALQLKLDDAGVEVAPIPPRTLDGYTLEQMELRVKRAKIGVGVSGGALLVGAVISLAVLMIGVSCVASFEPCSGSQTSYLAGVITGGVLFVGGLAGTITSGIKLRRRKRQLRQLQEAHYGTPRRVQWDLARARLVF